MVRVNGLTDGIPPVLERPATARPGAAASFESTLGGALESLDGLQKTADGEANKLALGAGNLHETALALEKADVGMRLAVKVRNKVVEAYQEVMRMNV